MTDAVHALKRATAVIQNEMPKKFDTDVLNDVVHANQLIFALELKSCGAANFIDWKFGL